MRFFNLLFREKNDSSVALLIAGARRVGKSYIAEEFAKAEYKSYILINFSNTTSEIKDIMEKDGILYQPIYMTMFL